MAIGTIARFMFHAKYKWDTDMKVGDLVMWKKGEDCGIVIEVPPPDDYWGETAVVCWKSGDTEEITVPHKYLEVICE